MILGISTIFYFCISKYTIVNSYYQQYYSIFLKIFKFLESKKYAAQFKNGGSIYSSGTTNKITSENIGRQAEAIIAIVIQLLAYCLRK